MVGEHLPNTYDFVNRSLSGAYASYLYDDKNFIGLARKDFSTADHFANGDGWKFHLTIHPDDLPRAWDIVSGIVMRNNVGAAKVATPENAVKFHDPRCLEAGKQITIFGPGNLSWADLMREIEIALRQNNIRPSVQSIEGDRTIPGSRYAGYRNDKAFRNLQPYRNPSFIDREEPGYVGSKEIREDLIPRGVVRADMAHNPSNQPDSLQNMEFYDVFQKQDFPKNHELPVKAASMGQFQAPKECAVGASKMDARKSQPAPTLEEAVAGKLQSNSLEYSQTTSGRAVLIKGGPQELLRIREQLGQRGIETIFETQGNGFGFGEGLRVRNASMGRFEALTQHKSGAIPAAVLERTNYLNDKVPGADGSRPTAGGNSSMSFQVSCGLRPWVRRLLGLGSDASGTQSLLGAWVGEDDPTPKRGKTRQTFNAASGVAEQSLPKQGYKRALAARLDFS
jgi:hypothetical protein